MGVVSWSDSLSIDDESSRLGRGEEVLPVQFVAKLGESSGRLKKEKRGKRK